MLSSFRSILPPGFNLHGGEKKRGESRVDDMVVVHPWEKPSPMRSQQGASTCPFAQIWLAVSKKTEGRYFVACMVFFMNRERVGQQPEYVVPMGVLEGHWSHKMSASGPGG